MIDIKDFRNDPDKYRKAAADKHIGVDVDALIKLDGEYKELFSKQQLLTAEKNQIGKQIGQIAGRMKKASDDEKTTLQVEMKSLQARPVEIKAEEHALAEKIATIEPERMDLLMRLPQPQASDVPLGKDDAENVEIKTWGTPKQFDFEAKDHVALGMELGMIDVERGVKVAGSRAYYLTGAGALLHQAILRLAFDMMVFEKGFTPQNVPVLVREPAMLGTGYLPAGRDQAYEMAHEDPLKFLVGTAEVSLTAYHQDEIVDREKLPLKTVAMSPCFRREAGTYGKDTHGLYRIHQFDKVEQVIICKNDEELSKKFHQEILENSEEILQRLGLAYRVVYVCSGDLGQGQVAKYDIETWMPSRESFGETHSASRFYDFQARRLNLRYKDEDGKTQFCHTLNNTVIASPRILIPVMETYQNADGSITVPECLRKYMGGMEKIETPQ
ncbi:serine--tRNA ligase [Poriferisphaera sp. WC338]|uniref:serine--tRNA ligase n=1 Tax=Poriferisphaera sp. WC338 TaxID=3425129 RepID=UPI003D81BD81